MSQAEVARESSRVSALDGLRGIAALVVVVGHTIGATKAPPGIAGPSVQLFFVLSGYCLAASALRGNGLTDRAQFYIRRIFRIHPPFVAALLLAWSLTLIPRSNPCCDGLSSWILNFTHLTMPAADLVQYLGFPGMARNLMPVGWTLEVEMIFSLLLPLMVLIAREGHWSLALGLSYWALVQDSPAYLGQGFAFHFVVGILVYEANARLARYYERAPRLMAFILLGAVLYLTAIGLRFVPVQWNVFAWMDSSVTRFALALSSAAMIVAAVHLPRVRQTLEWRPVAFLGRVSYSVYLLHFTVLLVFMRFIVEPLSNIEIVMCVLAVVAVSIVCAAVMYRLVEIPSIRVGNWLCVQLAHKTHGREHLSRITG